LAKPGFWFGSFLLGSRSFPSLLIYVCIVPHNRSSLVVSCILPILRTDVVDADAKHSFYYFTIYNVALQ